MSPKKKPKNKKNQELKADRSLQIKGDEREMETKCSVCGPGLNPAQVKTSVVIFNTGKVSPIQYRLYTR